MSDDQTFNVVWYLSLLLMVLAGAVLPARSQRPAARNAAWWVLIGGFLFAVYRTANGSCCKELSGQDLVLRKTGLGRSGGGRTSLQRRRSAPRPSG